MSYLLGQTRTLTASFTAGGVPANPTTITLTITAPDGTVTTPAPTHDGIGEYSHALLLNQAGTWLIGWVGTGAVPVDESELLIVLDPAHQGPSEGPCDWISWADVSDYCTPPEIAPALQDAVLRAATRTAWSRSCKQFGLCSIVRARVTPLCSHAFTWRTGYNYEPGYYPTLGWGGCGCGGYEFLPIDLGTAPVVSVQGVWINGTALDSGSYRVDDWRRLVRTDGNTWGPTTLQPDQGGDDTIEVSWTYGVAVPDDGKMAVALLACKYAREADGDCEPSSNATQINREGVSITIQPPKGDTGIVLVEQWLSNFECGKGGIFDAGARRSIARVNT